MLLGLPVWKVDQLSLSALPKLASWPALPSRLIVPPFLYQYRSLVLHNQGEVARGKSESQNSILASNMESEAISRSPVAPMSNHPLNSSVTGVHSTPGGLGFPNLTKSVHILHAYIQFPSRHPTKCLPSSRSSWVTWLTVETWRHLHCWEAGHSCCPGGPTPGWAHQSGQPQGNAQSRELSRRGTHPETYMINRT